MEAGRISNVERYQILVALGEIASGKYDEFVVEGGNAVGYKLEKLKGSLHYKADIRTFENEYFLKGKDEHWTEVAGFFEYGTGIYNTQRAGKYRAGYIRPRVAEYMRFLSKDGKWVMTKKVRGVKPVMAMQKAVKYVEFNRVQLQRQIRMMLRMYEDD